MISIDTETTGLWWQHDTVPFAIGVYNGTNHSISAKSVNPTTRQLMNPWGQISKDFIRSYFDSGDTIVFQNANFDLKALCKAGILDWHEPGESSFWENIIELGHLSHLNDSRDSGSASSLKALSKKYLSNSEHDYEKELGRVVNRCRGFCRNRNDWQIASETTIPHAPLSSEFVKCDFWLPAAIIDHYPDQGEAKKFFGEDYPLLSVIVKDYLKKDTEYTWDLACGFVSELSEKHENPQELLSMNSDLFHVIWKMETLGIHTHKDTLDNAIAICNEWIKKLHNRCCEISGIDTYTFTDAILRKLLYGTYGLAPVSYTKVTKEPRVNDASRVALLRQCIEIMHPKGEEFLTNYMAFKKYDTKLRYLDSYKRATITASKVPYSFCEDTSDTYLFPGLKSTGTATTRFSGYNPNPQNIEKPGKNPFEDEFEGVSSLLEKSPSLRTVFGPPKGYWWFPIDYAQLQLRIFAYATKEPDLIQSFLDGKDYHDFMARVIFDVPDDESPSSTQRRIAKNVNFGFIFGSSEKKIDSLTQRSGLYSYLMDMFPNAKDFIQKTREQIQETGIVYTMGGYPLHIPLRWFHGRQSYAAHCGVNYKIQGGEGEIVKKAMVLCDAYLEENYSEGRLVMNIHDELVFQTPEKPPKTIIKSLCRLMESAGESFGITTPVEPSVCFNNLAVKKQVIL